MSGRSNPNRHGVVAVPVDPESPVVPLRALGRASLPVAGGKGANLGELVRAGFPVPPGFVVTTAAYARFVAANGLAAVIARADAALREPGAAIRAAFEAAPIPADLAQDVLRAYATLGAGAVAVRSSATAEDLPTAAFAGQQETFLNVSGGDALLDAVRRCWASLWSDRAIAYRARLGLDPATVQLAVVVQRLVPAECAGVLFTANPVTGARDEVVIDASPGLGEAVVAGLVTPDHVVLRRGRRGWRVAAQTVGRREVVIRPRAGGGTEEVAPAGAASQPALPARALRDLARLGTAIAAHFGAPQDVEWAWADGRIAILQARPITALPEPPPRPNFVQRMEAGMVAELLPARPYPLEETTWLAAVLTAAVLGPASRLLGLRGRVAELFVEEDGVAVRLADRPPLHPTPAILGTPLRLLRLAVRYDPTRWQADPLLPAFEARVRALDARAVPALAWPDLLATLRDTLGALVPIGRIRLRYAPRVILAAAGLRLLLGLVRRPGLFGTLVLPGVETKTLEANRALEALAARIRSDPALAALFARHAAADLWAALESPDAPPAAGALLVDLRAFLDRYGHRETAGTLQLSQPTWRDAPEAVLGILQGLARAEARPPAAYPAWEAARDAVLAQPLLRLPPLRAAFRALLTHARLLPQLREDTRFYATMILPVLRRTVLEIGARLVATGALAAPEDVYFLRLADLAAIHGWPPASGQVAALRALVARRQARWAALATTPLVDPRLFRETGAGPDVLAQGTPGSPGVAAGPVRVIRDSTEFGALQPGDVLVAPYTNPAWTPLFQRAAAVVVDSGGPASHAAIVAREYGIPAVMGTVDGTRRLTDGMRVRVDGHRGVVVRAPEEAPGGG